MSYAIDFGTSNTVVARWNAATQQPQTLSVGDLSVQLGENPALVPSLAYVQDAHQGQVFVGQQVRDRGLDLNTDPRFFRSFKRGIGAAVQGFLPELDGQAMTFERVGHLFLRQLVQQLQTSDPAVKQSLVFTVPVDSFEAYRHWLAGVSQDLQVEQVQLLDEPTAAALGYGMANQEILLVVDFGGGTLDLALVQLDVKSQSQARPLGFILKWGEKLFTESGQAVKTARVIAKSGQNLGGSDIDNWLSDYFAVTQGLPHTPLTLRLAERLKIQLSGQPQASEIYFNDETFESYELQLNREQFAAILQEHQFFERLDKAMFQLLQQARRQGIEVENVDAVLMVGGTTQIPAVQTWVQQYFDPAKICRDRPFEAIAQGALQLSQGFELQDFLYHGYGIRYWDRRQNSHNWHPLIPAGQPYPMSNPVELVLGASVDNQPSIELIIGELGTETGGTEVFFDGDRLITRSIRGQAQVQPLNDREGARSIARLTPPGHPGSDRIKVLFWVDRQRFLRMTVEDLLIQDTLVEDQVIVQLS